MMCVLQSGNHYIHVTLDGAPMRDSPFRLRVGGKDECDPTAIIVSCRVSKQLSDYCIFRHRARASSPARRDRSASLSCVRQTLAQAFSHARSTDRRRSPLMRMR